MKAFIEKSNQFSNHKIMKTVFNWIFKSKEDLSKKWWHRLFKVLFILGIAIFAIYSIYILVDSYSSITHKWNYVDSFSTRLNEEPYSGEVFSITDLYDKDEVVSED